MAIDPVITPYGRQLAEEVGREIRDQLDSYHDGMCRNICPVLISSPAIRTI